MNPVEVYINVSHSQLSIARHYGGLKVNGSLYEYDTERDTLTRSDIAVREKKFKAAERKKWMGLQKEVDKMNREMEQVKQELMF